MELRPRRFRTAAVAVFLYRATAAKALRVAECAAWRGGFAEQRRFSGAGRFVTLSCGLQMIEEAWLRRGLSPP